MLLDILIVFITIFGLFYYSITKNYSYWKKRGVVFIPPKFPLGLLHDQLFGGLSTGENYQKWYNEYKEKGLTYVGGFVVQQPTLIILDLDLAKHILIKDFSSWVSRDFVPTTHEHISKHLFAMEGQAWKDMRVKLTPTFTSGKMKNMFLLMEKCAEQLQEHIDTVILKSSSREFKVKDLTARFTTDIIATCAFGLEVNCIKHRDNDFYRIGQLIFQSKRSTVLKFFSHKCLPTISKLLRVNFYEPRMSDALTGIVRDTIDYRKQNGVTRNDFIDLLLKVKENKCLDDNEMSGSQGKEHGSLADNSQQCQSDSRREEKSQLTLEEMTAQAFVFFAAGFETAASTTSFCLYELAKHPEVQETLRQEIDKVVEKYGGKVTYQAIQDMSYMEQVVNETLRMYASLPVLVRVSTAHTTLPGTGLEIEPGVRVHIPLYAFHHDPAFYPDPYRFDPSRFAEPLARERHPCSFMPFGEGPRNCIGLRFGKLQVKVGLVAILSKFRLFPAADTPPTLEVDPHIVFTTSKHPYSLRIARREDDSDDVSF